MPTVHLGRRTSSIPQSIPQALLVELLAALKVMFVNVRIVYTAIFPQKTEEMMIQKSAILILLLSHDKTARTVLICLGFY